MRLAKVATLIVLLGAGCGGSAPAREERPSQPRGTAAAERSAYWQLRSRCAGGKLEVAFDPDVGVQIMDAGGRLLARASLRERSITCGAPRRHTLGPQDERYVDDGAIEPTDGVAALSCRARGRVEIAVNPVWGPANEISGSSLVVAVGKSRRIVVSAVFKRDAVRNWSRLYREPSLCTAS